MSHPEMHESVEAKIERLTVAVEAALSADVERDNGEKVHERKNLNPETLEVISEWQAAKAELSESKHDYPLDLSAEHARTTAELGYMYREAGFLLLALEQYTNAVEALALIQNQIDVDQMIERMSVRVGEIRAQISEAN